MSWEGFSYLFSGRHLAELVLFFFFKCLLEFASKTIWAWAFLLKKIFSCEFNFLIDGGIIQVTSCIFSEFW